MNTRNLSKTIMMLALIVLGQPAVAQYEPNYYLPIQQNFTIFVGEKFKDIPAVSKNVSYEEVVNSIKSFVEICETKTSYLLSRDLKNLNLDIVTPRGKYSIEIQKSTEGKDNYLVIYKLNLNNTSCLLAQDRNYDGFQNPTTNEYTYFQSGSRCENGVMEITSIKPKILSEIDRKYLAVILYLKEIIEQS